VSHDESYIMDEQLNDSYDSTNVFNIFEHELQIKKKFKGKIFAFYPRRKRYR